MVGLERFKHLLSTDDLDTVDSVTVLGVVVVKQNDLPVGIETPERIEEYSRLLTGTVDHFHTLSSTRLIVKTGGTLNVTGRNVL